MKKSYFLFLPSSRYSWQVFVFLLLSFSFINSFAQESTGPNPKNNSKLESSRIDNSNGVQAAGDKIQFKDGSNIIMEIQSTGSFGGQIFMPNIQSASNPKWLYNYNGELYWGGVPLASSGGSDNDWTISGNNIYNSNSANVGIGTTNPLSKLSINAVGDVKNTIHSETSLDDGRAVYGYATSATGTQNYGGYFRAKGSSGRGVFGFTDGIDSRAVYGNTTGSNAVGVFGNSTGSTGSGISGTAEATGNTTNYGGYFTAAGDAGRGVYGLASSNSSGTNYGGYFESAGLSGRGVYGYATNSSGSQNYGGYFRAKGTSGRGVFGFTDGIDSRAVYGNTSGSNAVGVFGNSTGETGSGVKGTAENIGNNMNYGGYFEASGQLGRGVYAKAPLTGWAGYFDGRLNVQSVNEISRLTSTSSIGYLTIYNNTSSYIGYLGIYNSASDIDIGTGGGNSTGKLNLVTQALPRVTVDKDGNVGIGTTTPAEPLHVKQSGQGAIRIESGSNNWTIKSGVLGDFFVAYNGVNKASISKVDGSYSTYSDRRLKNSIRDLQNVLSSILMLKPKKYFFNDDITNKEQIGLIAQDVEMIFPEAVSEKEGYKAINYSIFGVLAIEAIKEQQTKIDELEARLARLEESR